MLSEWALGFLAVALIANAVFVTVAWCYPPPTGSNPKKPPTLRMVTKLVLLLAVVLLVASCIASCREQPLDAGTSNGGAGTTNDASTRTTARREVVCPIAGFEEGRDAIPESMVRTPCVAVVLSALLEELPDQLLIIGHVDNRELEGAVRKIYGDNLSLALQRARSVRDWLERAYQQQRRATSAEINFSAVATLVSSGAMHVGEIVSRADRQADRFVEIRVRRAPAPSRAAPPPTQASSTRVLQAMLDPNTSLTMLAFLVALSAYLASVRAHVKTVVPPPKQKSLVLLLISVADLPMILAALCLGLRVFFGWSPVFLTWSFTFFVFAAMTMIILHAREWILSGRHILR